MDLSVILPAHNEAGYIEPCLEALLASDGPGAVQVIVVPNGCTDATADLAQGFAERAAARGWLLEVHERAEGGKIGALNAGDAVAASPSRLYLDADVIVEAGLLPALMDALGGDAPVYASGVPRVAPAKTWVTRAYARFWSRLPFVTHGVPGFGAFAVNAAGRARWGAFPQIISDDTFVRLSFAPAERHRVAAGYAWPMVEGVSRLIRVRRRQDEGVAEVARLYPELRANDGTPPLTKGFLLRRAAADPVGFAVYVAVALAVRMRKSDEAWARGR